VTPRGTSSEDSAGDGPRTDHAGNLLGAFALAVADRASDAVGEAAGQSGAAAAALSALDQFLDAPSVDLLRRVLGLTPSGAVRLVDKLAAAGYVERGPGPDARTVSLHLTDSGRRAAREVQAARAVVLDGALETLTPAERATFAALTGRMLVGLMRGPEATRWMCRLCDLGACGRAEGHCPVANEARARWGAAPE
jgi:DNA-binding MarR family transcriptional regulator